MMSVAGLADSRLAATQKLTKPPRASVGMTNFLDDFGRIIDCVFAT
jgi:hypothetical protein